MKKFLLSLLLVLTIMSSAVLAVDLSDYPQPFVDSTSFIGKIVIGADAPSSDVLAAIDIQSGLSEAGYTIPLGASVFDYEVNFNDALLIVVGCDNELAEDYFGDPEDCRNIGQGYIIYDDKLQRLYVVGSTDEDTRRAALVLREYDKFNLDSTKVLVEGVSLTDMTVQLIEEGWEGNQAKVTIIEYADFQCPFCKSFYDETLPLIEEKYGDNVELEFRHLPLSFHEHAWSAAEAAECARNQGMFKEYHNMLFENQAFLDDTSLKKYAATLGLDTKKFNQCVDNNETYDTVQAHFLEASSKGVSGTPTFFINGQQLIGAQPFSEFEVVLDKALDWNDGWEVEEWDEEDQECWFSESLNEWSCSAQFPEAGSVLAISDLSVHLDGLVTWGVDNEEIVSGPNPGQEVEFQITLLNKGNQDIEDIEVTITTEVYGKVSSYDIQKEIELSKLKAGDQDTVDISFFMPSDADYEIYETYIHVEGEGEDGKEYSDLIVIGLEVGSDDVWDGEDEWEFIDDSNDFATVFLEEGESTAITLDNKQYTIGLLYLGDDDKAKFIVNGETTDLIVEKEQYTLVDGTIIAIWNIWNGEVEANLWTSEDSGWADPTVEIKLSSEEHISVQLVNGKTHDISVSAIVDDTVWLVINGQVLPALEEDDEYLLADGSLVEIDNVIDDGSVELVYLEITGNDWFVEEELPQPVEDVEWEASWDGDDWPTQAWNPQDLSEKDIQVKDDVDDLQFEDNLVAASFDLPLGIHLVQVVDKVFTVWVENIFSDKGVWFTVNDHVIGPKLYEGGKYRLPDGSYIELEDVDDEDVTVALWTKNRLKLKEYKEPTVEEISTGKFRTGDLATAGGALRTSVSIENPFDEDLEDVSISLTMPDFALRQSAGPLDIDAGETFEQEFSLELSEDTPTGYYVARLVIEGDGFSNVEHREIWIE